MSVFNQFSEQLPEEKSSRPKPEGSYGLFTSFGSFEEMLAFVDEARARADSQVQAWQRLLEVGDYFVSYSAEAEVVIYSQIVAPEPGEPELLENYRLVRGYSVIVPEGELGEAHIVSASGRLTQAQFEKVRALEWPTTRAEFAAVVEDDQVWQQRLTLISQKAPHISNGDQ